MIKMVLSIFCLLTSTGLGMASDMAAGQLMFTIGVHVEPLGETAQGYRGGRGDYRDPALFQRHVQYLYALAGVVERHGGALVVQVQSPFTQVAADTGSLVLADLEARGHEIGLHFHEGAHLGPDPERLPPEEWCRVMREEIELIHAAGAEGPIRYWSGGNLYPGILEAARCAGLDIYGDWKDPRVQATAAETIGVVPWRPAGGPDPADMSHFAAHDPGGAVIYLPDGMIDPASFQEKRRLVREGGPGAWFSVLADYLGRSLAAALPDRVNIFHFTVHPGEFPLELIDSFLAEHVDPLVARGAVRWATFSQMADAFSAWEADHPGVEPRSGAPRAMGQGECRGYITFAVNVHDFVNVDESADTVLRLVDLFARYGVRGDFHLTGPQV